MKNCLLLFCWLVMGCASKHKDPGFASVEGKWTYTTPDTKMAATFDLTKSSSGVLLIENQTLTINGTLYQSVPELTGVSLPTIQKIHINANDAAAVFPYEIEFNNCVVSADFTTIDVPTATYTWPWGTTHTLTAIKIKRRP